MADYGVRAGRYKPMVIAEGNLAREELPEGTKRPRAEHGAHDSEDGAGDECGGRSQGERASGGEDCEDGL